MKSNKKILITIIVVSLNTKKDTIRTIRSIKGQSFKNYEILVIDGQSKDGTTKFLKSLSKSLFFISEKDKGIYYAMNKGIKLARAKWTIFLNSGDIFYNSKVLKKFSRIKDKCNYDVIFGDTVIDYKSFLRFTKGKYFNFFTTKIPFCHQSVFTKTKSLQKKLFDTRYKIASDFDFFYYLYLKKKNFFHFHTIISKITIGGISDKKRFICLKEYLKILINNKCYFGSLFQICNIIYFIIISLIKKIFNFKTIHLMLNLKYKLLKQIK